MIQDPGPPPDQLPRLALGIGILMLIASAFGAWWEPEVFLASYLVAYLLCLGLALGGLAVIMLHHLVPGRWGLVAARPLEAATRTLPLLAILFVPIVVGVGWLFPWAQPERVAADAVLQHRQPYLNPSFFLLRAAIYFVIWISLAHWQSRWSLHAGNGARQRALSAPGLVVYGFTVSFAACDWVMSLQSQWYSAIYGFLFMTGQGISSFAFATLAAALLANRRPYGDLLTPGVFQDLGNLLLAFIMLWGYAHASQLIIVWSGNLPEEIIWYHQRITGGWRTVTAFLAMAGLAIPFVMLLFKAIKRHPTRLAGLAGGLLALRALDLYWQVMPTLMPLSMALSWLNLSCLAGVGGVWLAVYWRELFRRPLVPPAERLFTEEVGHG